MKTRLTSKHWIGVAALACAACCAVPLGAVMGLGAAGTATGALLAGVETETILCTALLASFLLAGLYLWVRQRRAMRQRCETSCSADASCCVPKSNS
jgi:membrane protein implicated in regulation of membrane protease activity